MKLLSIASGSSGNSIYVGSNYTNILVDAGISGKRIEEGLRRISMGCSDINAICITHEHSDHIRALGVLSRRYEIPIYATQGTIDAILDDMSLGVIPGSLFHTINANEEFMIGDIRVHPFSIYHDAADPVAYRFSCDGKKIGIATDIGHYDDYIINELTGLNAVLLESNHDIRMLEAGSYPYYLKRRILGDSGHLSNENCGKLICKIINDDMKGIFLGHLSKENNYPELAYEAVRCEISQDPCKYMPDDLNISVARRECPSCYLEI